MVAFNTNVTKYGKFVPMPTVGKMYHFVYNAKWKMKLPYWDAFPIDIISGPAPNGFYGINFHYVVPSVRKAILDELTEHAIKYKGDQRAIFRADYDFLQTLANEEAVMFCFKRYLYSHVQSAFLQIDPVHYDTIIRLPTARWHRKDRPGRGPY